MSSAKRPYNETISSNSSNPINTTLNNNNDNNDYIVSVEEQHEVEEDMDIEPYLKVEQISKQSDSFKNQQEVEEESFISGRRKRLNTDKDTFISNPFPSTLNNHSFQSLSSTSSRNTLNYSSLRNTISSTPYPSSRNTPFYKVPTTTNVTYHPLSESKSNYISPRDSFNNNTSNSTLKVSEIEQKTKTLSPIDLLMSSPPISTSAQKTNRTRNTSNSSLTLTTNNIDDFNYVYSSRNSTSKLRARTNTNTNTNTNTSNDSSAEALNSTISSYFNATDPYSSLNSSNNDNPSSNSENTINIDSSSNDNYSNNDNINDASSNDGNNNNPSSNNNNIIYNNTIYDEYSSSNNDSISNNDNFSSIYTAITPNNQQIRAQLTKNESKGPFKPIYSQLYDDKRMVVDTESFNYLIQLYEFCDNSSTRLQSNVTSILRDLVLLLNNQIDGFDIPFIEHHKWNGSSFYGPIDIITLLDQLDDGLGLSSAEFVFYDRNYNYDDHMRASGFVLQYGCRKTYRRNNFQGSSLTSTSKNSGWSNDTNDLQDNELRHAVLDKDAEREAQLFLELLAQEEDDGAEDNGTEQGENSTEQDSNSEHSEQDESDSFTEISKESEDDDDDYSLNEDFASTSIQQPIDTFGNPINSRTTSIVARHISRPSGNEDGNETDDDSGNLTESTFEEVDFSDIESIATDSTIEDGWHSISRDNN